MDFRLRKQAWQQYVAGLIATGDAVLGELDGVGLEIGQLESAFISYATYPDVEEWPAPEVTLPDLKPVTAELHSYAAHMERLAPTFPVDVGNDLLMNKYRRIARIVRQADLENPADLLDILAECGTVNVVQRNWPKGRGRGDRKRNAGRNSWSSMPSRSSKSGVIAAMRSSCECFRRQRRPTRNCAGFGRAELPGSSVASGGFAAGQVQDQGILPQAIHAPAG